MLISDPERPSRERFITQVPGLDELLDGGFLVGGVYLVQGSPGSGKTLLGSQIAFDCAKRGGRVLFLSMIGETHGRMINNLSNLRFFDAGLLRESITILSAYNIIANEGVEGLLKLIATESRKQEISLVVMDGLFIVEEVFHSDREFRKLLNGLTHQAELLQCTMMMLTNSSRPSSSPEYAMVDGWIELSRQRMKRRAIRHIEVHKLRGSNLVSGQHCMDINEEGLAVYPRLDAVAGIHPERSKGDGVLGSNLDGLDKLLGGGLPVASTTLLMGSPGSGKTSFGLQFLAACSPEHPGLFFGFYETAKRLIAKSSHLKVDLEKLIGSGALHIIWQPPTENLLDQLGHILLDHVRAHGSERLVIDGIGPLVQSAADGDHSGSYLSALANELREIGCTAVFTAESPGIGGYTEIKFSNMSAVAENIIALRYAGHETSETRTIRILKLRESSFDAAIHEILIGSTGLTIGKKVPPQPGPGLDGAQSPT